MLTSIYYKEPVLMKKAFTVVPPLINQNWGISTSVQKCTNTRLKAKKYRRQSKLFGDETLRGWLFISIVSCCVLLMILIWQT